MIKDKLKAKLATLPLEPGCYLMKNSKNDIIYVGKAKKLKNRVNQYFIGAHDYKTTKLVSLIEDFEYIVTHSEKEALLLEINLIKKHRPRFNIIFMDDKTYPYIKLTQEKYPTCRVVRDAKKDRKAKYFGPFPDSFAAYQTMKLLNQLYPLRKCKSMPKKVCLYYHIGQCLGPCEFDIDENTYKKLVSKITSFLKGDVKNLLEELKLRMQQEADQLEFEKAQKSKELLQAITHIVDRQAVQVGDNKNRDVFAYYEDKGYIAIQGLLLRDGKLLEREFVTQPLYEDANDNFITFLLQYYEKHPYPKEIVVPSDVDIELLAELVDAKIMQPQKSFRKKLLDMAYKNAKQALNNKFEQLEHVTLTKENSIEELRKHCKLEYLNRIEVFDNSHTFGQFTVSAMIVYQDLGFRKSDYRLYKLHTGNSDVDAMKEALYRRYFRAIKEEERLPDLLLVDGGIAQVNAAKEILSMLNLSIKVCGLVKDEKHNTDGLLDEHNQRIAVERNSDVFFLITNLQDEVHRFAINYHRKLRTKAQTKSILDEIEGVGAKRKKQLMTKFKSFKRIKEATIEELNEVVPLDVAKRIQETVHEN